MKGPIDKQNDNPALHLDFKKKPKQKPKTDRSVVEGSNSLKKQSNEQLNLIQKRKQYSKMLRQKNINLAKKKSQPLEQESFNIQFLEQNKSHIFNTSMSHQFKSQRSSSKNLHQSNKSTILHSNQSKSKLRDSKRDKIKQKQITAMAEDIKHYSLIRDISSPNAFREQISQIQSPSIQQFSRINHFQQDKLDRLALQPQIFDQKILPSESQEMKQIELLKKQNSTFKKQLNIYRKQNSACKKQNQEFKKQIELLKKKNDQLIQQGQEQIRFIESFKQKMINNVGIQIGKQSSVEDIIRAYQFKIFQLTGNNNKLQLKTHTLEKRLADDAEFHKKNTTRQVNIWKQRYIKARNQNIRLKDIRSSTTLLQISNSSIQA